VGFCAGGNGDSGASVTSRLVVTRTPELGQMSCSQFPPAHGRRQGRQEVQPEAPRKDDAQGKGGVGGYIRLAGPRYVVI
jgi:hypothetical protein